jgi:hypothetical protein
MASLHCAFSCSPAFFLDFARIYPRFYFDSLGGLGGSSIVLDARGALGGSEV